MLWMPTHGTETATSLELKSKPNSILDYVADVIGCKFCCETFTLIKGISGLSIDFKMGMVNLTNSDSDLVAFNPNGDVANR